MGLKQMPKCKEQTCRFCQGGKYCTILKSKPKECRFYKERNVEDVPDIEERN